MKKIINYLFYFFLTNKKIIIFFKSFERIFFSFFQKKNLDYLLRSKFFNFFQLFSKEKYFFLIKEKKYFLFEKNNNFKNVEILNKINEDGFCKILNIQDEKIKKASKYFESSLLYNSHVPFSSDQKKISYEEFINAEDLNYGSYDIKTSFNCPLIRDLIFDKKILNIAEKYLLTKKFHLYSINTMLTKKSKILHQVTDFHRDYDSPNSITFFLYLSDVDSENGATQIVKSSHYNKNINANDIDKISFLEGKAGTLFAADTWALHSGNKKILKPRLVSWIRYSSFSARPYYHDKNFYYDSILNNLKFNI